MQQLSELDSSFLFLENNRTPLHVGGIFVFKKNKNSQFSYNRFRDILASKLANQPFFRKRLVEKPLGIEMPYWADDPQFDIDNHLKYIQLKKQKQSDNFLDYASEVFSVALDKSAPLWQAIYIDALESDQRYSKDHFALVLKVHITAIDGITGEDILSQLLSINPDIFEDLEPAPWEPEELPDTSSWLVTAYNGVLTLPQKLADIAKDTASSAFYTILYERLQKLNLPAGLMSVAITSINKSVSDQRKIDNVEIPLSSIRQIRRKIEGVTTNDVLMGICAEALNQLLKERDEKPNNSLIALAPISVRSKSLEVKSGNQLAATLFSLATTEENPIERIKLIHRAAKSSNSYDSAISANRLTELVPSCLAALSARVYSEFLLAQKHKPMFNLPIANIPGPQFPLYLEDNPLCQYICASPLFDGIDLALNLISYDGSYSITATRCPSALNTPFSEYVEKATTTIIQHLENPELLAQAEDEEAENSTVSTGFIEDAVGLVNNLFSLGSKDEAKKQ